jgi:hypothetical protein
MQHSQHIERHRERSIRCDTEDALTGRQRFNNFVNTLNNILRSGQMPNANNTNFQTCGKNGYWRIQKDRRVGHEGEIQIMMGQHKSCSKCRGFLKKAYNNVKRYEDERISTFNNRTANILLSLFENFNIQDFENDVMSSISYSVVSTTTTTTTTDYTPFQEVEQDENEEVEEYKDYGDDLPNDYLCPINMTPMKDPVICMDGHSYERKAIERWFRNNNKSPKTNQPLESKVLIPNHALRNAIEDYIKNH